MGYRVLGKRQDVYRGYEPRQGLEGPYPTTSGRIVYYDPKQGQYWDPTTDFYLDQEETDQLYCQLMQKFN